MPLSFSSNLPPARLPFAGSALSQADAAQKTPGSFASHAVVRSQANRTPLALASTSPAIQAPFAGSPLLTQLNIQSLGLYRSPAGFPLYHYVLANGHQVFIEQRPSQAISMRTGILAGSADEAAVYPSHLYGPSPFPSGLAHLDEHAHFLSTQHYPERNRWSKVVEGLGAYLNASTGYEVIQHELLFNREDLPNMLKLHAEAVLHPLYDPGLIFQEKRNVINECSERMEPPDAIIYSKAMELLFDRPHFQSLGNRSDVQGTTTDQLQQFFQTFYAPTNMVTVLSGDIKPEEVLPLLNEGFGNNPARPVPPARERGLKLALKPGEIRSVTMTDPQLTSSLVTLAFPGPTISQNRDRMAMLFLNEMLAGNALSLLNKTLQEKMNLANDVAMEYEPFNNTGMTLLQLDTEPGKEQNALNVTLNLLKQVAQQPAPPDLVERTREKLLEGFKQAQETSEASSELLIDGATRGNLDFLLHFEELAASITSTDIQRVAQSYLDTNRYALVYGLPGPEKSYSAKVSNQEGVLPNFLPEGTLKTPVTRSVLRTPADAVNTIAPFYRNAAMASGQAPVKPGMEVQA